MYINLCPPCEHLFTWRGAPDTAGGTSSRVQRIVPCHEALRVLEEEERVEAALQALAARA